MGADGVVCLEALGEIVGSVTLPALYGLGMHALHSYGYPDGRARLTQSQAVWLAIVSGLCASNVHSCIKNRCCRCDRLTARDQLNARLERLARAQEAAAAADPAEV